MPSGSSVPHVRRRAETSRPAFDVNEKTKGFLSNNVENETRVFVKTHFHHKNLCFTSDFFFPQLWGSEYHVLMRGELRQRWPDGSQGRNFVFSFWDVSQNGMIFFFDNFHGNSPATYCNSVGCLRMRWGSSTSAQNLQVEKQDSFVVSSWMTLTWTQFTRKHSGHASHDFGFLGLPLSTFETRDYLQCQVQFSMTNHSWVAPHALYSHLRLSFTRRFSLISFHLTKDPRYSKYNKFQALKKYETSWPAIIVDSCILYTLVLRDECWSQVSGELWPPWNRSEMLNICWFLHVS